MTVRWQNFGHCHKVNHDCQRCFFKGKFASGGELGHFNIREADLFYNQAFYGVGEGGKHFLERSTEAKNAHKYTHMLNDRSSKPSCSVSQTSPNIAR